MVSRAKESSVTRFGLKLSSLLAMGAIALFVGASAHAGILDKVKGKGKGKEEAKTEEAAETKAAAPAYTGPKQVVCVDAFEGAGKLGWDEGPVLAAMLTSALMDTGRFIVVERPKLDNAIKEQDLGAAGRINSQTALKIGEIVGASILVQGTVTKFEPGEEGKSGRVGVPIGGVSVGLGGSKVTSVVGMKLRLVDLTTTVVLDTFDAEAEGTYKSMGADIYAGGFSAGGDKFKKTPLGETSEKCVKQAVDHIIAKMADVPFSARVAKVDGKTVYINAGSTRGVQVGTVLVMYKQGEVIKDPDTGLPLSVTLTKTGSIKVDDVQEELSVCSMVDGKAPAVGDTVKIEQ
ncbi:MAG: CsgG/HfaB family protein [Candidatus Hydrogenedentales bacterium]